MRLRELRLRLFVRHTGMLVTLAFVAGVVFVWSGFYNVAASRDHWVITTWILEQVRVRSVATWSYFVEDPPPLDDPHKIRLGAAHFEGGCVSCHSRPGEQTNAIVSHMLPPPPLLDNAREHLSPKELFWTVKHGLKYTAMPAWPSQARNDEVWALTAFLLELPELSPEEYRHLAAVDRVGDGPDDGAKQARASETVALTQCTRCHGDETSPPISDLIPALGGQTQAYLERALVEYAEGTRPSGIMQPVAGLLGDDEIRSLAAYYSETDMTAPPQGDPESITRGRALAQEGDPERGVPACLACHSRSRFTSFPNIAGLSQGYIAAQLNVWRDGGRDLTVHGQIMAPIARRLTDEQVEDAAAYFSSVNAAELPGSLAASSAVDR
ncbi:cytochrome c553 [Mesorhizobium sp. J18]|uniref:c-type cytochrome n=1 Tax=Mesorhizobium sp. J18 TaxID=935263 RepID=UPI00119BFB02|nr:c-type cytochrome [Mesorhizobium sp. J18]TWG91030.1 cytochrome c553 [Mesorhizobium sp. J18]